MDKSRDFIELIENVDLSKIAFSELGKANTIRKLLQDKLGKDYDSLFSLYLLEIGKAMSERVKQEEVA